MKNKKIMQAWQAIEPDSAADARMLEAILARNRQGGTTKMKGVTPMKTLNWKRLAPVAACLVAAVAAVAIFSSTGFNVQAVELGNGETVNFSKTSMLLVTSMDFGGDVVSRDLTAEENSLLFGNLPVASFGTFDAGGRLLHAEGKSGNAKIILAAPGMPATDAILIGDAQGGEAVIRVSLTPDGDIVLVSAEYFVTKANSQGVRSIIYYATLDMDGVTAYIECGGSKSDSDSLKRELADVIDALTKHGAPDLASVTA